METKLNVDKSRLIRYNIQENALESAGYHQPDAILPPRRVRPAINGDDKFFLSPDP